MYSFCQMCHVIFCCCLMLGIVLFLFFLLFVFQVRLQGVVTQLHILPRAQGPAARILQVRYILI